MAFKTFTSTTLSASDVNTYLMKQTLIVCTSGTRPGSPVEGMSIFETDTDKVYIYNGSAWVEVLRLGQWTSFTSTLVNISAAANTGYWCRLAGRTIQFWISLTAGGSLSSPAGVTLPVAMASGAFGTFRALYLDTGTSYYVGEAIPTSTTQLDLYVPATGSTYASLTAISATVPHTWAANDVIYVAGQYEAAAST